ncbi:MAG: DNA repair protein RecN [Spirochaetes bacterium]|nr:DNA repair protein RecN [Spirochaetota bacterium]
MLEHVSVRDFALIEAVEFDLSAGFVVFTGETGAGKSLIVGALGFLFGDRADTGTIREGAEECAVSAVFRITENGKAIDWLQAHDLSDEDGRVTLRRGLKRSGRSYAYIQASAVTRADLEEFIGLLADIHGQHEHQSLLNEARHLDYLDGFASLDGERETYHRSYETWTALAREYRKKSLDAQKRENEEEFLAFTVKEIASAKIKKDEDDELAKEERILNQHEKLFSALKSALEGLSGGGGAEGAVQSLKRSSLEMAAAEAIDSELGELAARLESAYIEIEDVSSSLASHFESLRFDPLRLEEVLARQAELRRIKKKYGPSLDDVLERANRGAALLDSFDGWQDEKKGMEEELARRKDEVLAKAEALSQKRVAACPDLAGMIEAILSKLGMVSAKFTVSLGTRKNETGKIILGPAGKDEAAFLIAPNLGEPAKPLAKVASGGELSRIALAIRAVLASGGTAETLVFDEIDTGIGGEVAVAVGSYLKEISRFKQVLCVTHLATIAAKADGHFQVEKEVSAGRMGTKVRELTRQERESEIARMLSGDREGSLSLAHAAELLTKS